MEHTDLSQKAMLVKLSISQWSARKHDKGASAEVQANHGAAADSGRYSKNLLSKLATKPIQTAANTARTFSYSNTLPWNDSGFRILPSANFLRYSDGMRVHQQEFESCVNVFLNDYHIFRSNAEYDLGSLFNPQDYPDDAKISGLFAFETEIQPMPSAADFRVTLNQDDADRIKSQIENKVNANIEAATNDLWRRLYDATAHMASKLSDSDSIFRDSLVSNLCELCDLLPALNLTDDPKLEEMRREIESRLCNFEPDALRKNPVERATAAKEADEIATLMAAYMGN